MPGEIKYIYDTIVDSQKCHVYLQCNSVYILTYCAYVQTSSGNVQDIIEGKVEKRTKGVYVPIGGKKLLTFMDDFNMPAKDTFGSQPPLELIRLWLDYGFWYDRLKQVTKTIRVCGSV